MSQAAIILSVLFFTATIMCTAMALAWLHFGRKSHAATWAFAFGGGAVQWVVNALGVIVMPGSVVPVILAASLVVVTSSLVVIGARQRSGLSPGWGRFSIAGGLAIGLIILLYTLVDHVGLRAASSNLYAAVLMPLAAAAVLPRNRRPLAPEIAFAVMLLIFSAYQLALGMAGLAAGDGSDPAALDRYRLVLGIGLPPVYVGSGVAALFLLAGDLSESLRALITRDPLTGALNRRGIEQAATFAMANARRHVRPLAVVIADIDRFKTINDRWGHVAGDRALAVFADHVHAGVREEDLFARIGGDEFCLMLIDATAEAAAEVVERTRREMAAIEIAEAPGLALTASFGIAPFRREDLSFADILRRADEALYRSKAAGRNRVTIAA